MTVQAKILFREKTLAVSDHAIKRFLQRWPEVEDSPPPEKNDVVGRIEELLASSKEDDTMTSRRRLMRLFSNNFVGADYYRNGQWRFVIIKPETNPILSTIERAYRS